MKIQGKEQADRRWHGCPMGADSSYGQRKEWSTTFSLSFFRRQSSTVLQGSCTVGGFGRWSCQVVESIGNYFLEMNTSTVTKKHLLRKMRSTTAAGLKRQQARVAAQGPVEPLSFSSVAGFGMPAYGEMPGPLLPALYFTGAPSQPASFQSIADARQSMAAINQINQMDLLSRMSGSHTSTNAPFLAHWAPIQQQQVRNSYLRNRRNLDQCRSWPKGLGCYIQHRQQR
jgi:hypothetical protein